MTERRASDEPFWWYRDTSSLRARLLIAGLTPASALYGALAARRMTARPKHVSTLPVICVGNFTAGGTGKTPLVREIVTRLRQRGQTPVVLTRGYGGSTEGPHLVDRDSDTAASVGDEPCLIARDCAVVVSRDRAAGARFIEAHSSLRADIIVMDDGLQNPDLEKSLTIAVLDTRRAIGNGRTLPAGPLRAPLATQLRHVSLLACVSPPDAIGTSAATPVTSAFSGPRLDITVAPSGDTAWLEGTKVLAFAGIGAPERFFTMLEKLGARVVARRAYPDHYAFEDRDADHLLREAANLDAILVTTEKDQVRLRGTAAALDALAAKVRVVPIRAALDTESSAMLDAALERVTARRRQ